MHPVMGPILTAAIGALVGCTAGTPTASAPSPAPTATPAAAATATPKPGPSVPAPETWYFGAVEEIRTATERQIIFQRGDDPSRKTYGEGGSHYVVVKGKTFMIHWQGLENLKEVKVGDTVNLHPQGWYACVEGADGNLTCQELFKIYKGTREQPPLFTP